MGEVFLSVQVSIDGFMAGPAGELDWTESDDEVDELMAEQLRGIDAMVLGHNAYRLLAPYWQDGPSGRAVDREQTRLMNEITKLVLSRGDPELSWRPAQRIGADLGAEVARIKAECGDVAVFAGAQTARALLPYVDEVRLLVYPVLLGSGLALFGDLTGAYRLVSAHPFPLSGAVQLRYRPA